MPSVRFLLLHWLVGTMPIEVMNVGFGNMVIARRIVAVTRAGSAPVRRMIDGAEKSGRLVDATNGRRTRAVIVTDSDHIILSHLNPQTIGERRFMGCGRACRDRG